MTWGVPDWTLTSGSVPAEISFWTASICSEVSGPRSRAFEMPEVSTESRAD